VGTACNVLQVLLSVQLHFLPVANMLFLAQLIQLVHIWDAETGQIMCGPLEGHTGSVRSVAFSSDGRHIISGSADQKICIWDVKTGNIVAGHLEGHTDHVRSVAFSPDGMHVVSGSNDCTVCIWDANTGKMVSGPFKGHSDRIRTVAFSPNGSCVASGSADQTAETVSGLFEGHTKSVSLVAFSPDGKFVVSGANDTIWIWSVECSRLIQDVDLHLSHEWITSDNLMALTYQDDIDPQAQNNAQSLVLWVPPASQQGICGKETAATIGAHLTRVDWSRFVHGSSWQQCFNPTVSEPTYGGILHLQQIHFIFCFLLHCCKFNLLLLLMVVF
jgi:WD40 repeat protein